MVEPKSIFKNFLWVICGLMYLVTASLWVVLPDTLTLNLSTALFTIGFSILMIIWDRRKFKKYYNGPYFYKLISLSISILLIFWILAAVNYLAYKHPRQVDISDMEHNSLTVETVSMLKNIKGKITIRIFGRKNEILAIKALTNLYRFENNQIDVEQVDIELRPDLVKKHEIYKSGTIEIEYNNRVDQITEASELALTNSILRLTRKRDPQILFTKGHGELSLEDKGKDGIYNVIAILKKAYFNIYSENTLSLFEIKENTDLIVIWGPQTAFMRPELQLIENFLGRGGKLLVGLDPTFNGDKHVDLRAMLLRFGIKIDNNIVIDQISFIDGSNGSVPMISKIKSNHPILSIEEGPIFFPLVSGIRPGNNEDSKKFELFFDLKTSPFPASWADNNPEEMVKGKVVFNQDKDFKGPIDLIGISRQMDGPTKVVVIGNSTFVSNAYEKYGKNFNLFVNAISWLVKSGEIDEFNLPLGKNEPVFLNRHQIGLIFYFSVLFLPLVFVVLSIWFYQRKKKL